MPIFRNKKKTFFVSNFRGGGGEPRGRVSITWRERLARMKAAIGGERYSYFMIAIK